MRPFVNRLALSSVNQIVVQNAAVTNFKSPNLESFHHCGIKKVMEVITMKEELNLQVVTIIISPVTRSLVLAGSFCKPM